MSDDRRPDPDPKDMQLEGETWADAFEQAGKQKTRDGTGMVPGVLGEMLYSIDGPITNGPTIGTTTGELWEPDWKKKGKGKKGKRE